MSAMFCGVENEKWKKIKNRVGFGTPCGSLCGAQNVLHVQMPLGSMMTTTPEC